MRERARFVRDCFASGRGNNYEAAREYIARSCCEYIAHRKCNYAAV